MIDVTYGRESIAQKIFTYFYMKRFDFRVNKPSNYLHDVDIVMLYVDISILHISISRKM